MNRDIPRALNFQRSGAAFNRLRAWRLAMICAVAFFATGVWWLILHFGGRAMGYPIGGGALVAVLGSIFLLLVLGLSMAAMAASSAFQAPRGSKRESVAVSARPRRRAG